MSDEDGTPLRRMFEDTRARVDAARAFYEMLHRRGELKSHRVLTYRCPQRCLLLDVLQTSQGLLVHSARYKLSATVNESSSSPSGRLNNTEDGGRHWKAHTFPIDLAVNLTANCDHVRGLVIEVDTVRADVAAARREVIV